MYFSFSANFSVKVKINDCHLWQTSKCKYHQNRNFTFMAILLCHRCSGVTGGRGGGKYLVLDIAQQFSYFQYYSLYIKLLPFNQLTSCHHPDCARPLSQHPAFGCGRPWCGSMNCMCMRQPAPPYHCNKQQCKTNVSFTVCLRRIIFLDNSINIQI